ncbi:MerR family transcriptional regulator [Beijerinckiaceae bacterium]|nr:MerR family transcriptional regulator [Beijerinckiaceae bacterium]
MAQEVTIGGLAKRAGVNVETIRYYQRRGLLALPDRPQGAYRRYAVDLAQRIHFIKRAQALGFTLAEIAGLPRRDATQACVTTRELALHKIALIDAKLADLAARRETLSALTAQCCTELQGNDCPIIQSLAQDEKMIHEPVSR